MVTAAWAAGARWASPRTGLVDRMVKERRSAAGASQAAESAKGLHDTRLPSWTGSSLSVLSLATNMGERLAGNLTDGNLDSRVDAFNRYKRAQGTLVLDKEQEDFKNVAAPISGLDRLLAISQEHISAVSRIPLVKWTGKAWIKNALDHVIQSCMNEPGLELVSGRRQRHRPTGTTQTLNILATAGIKTRDEARDDLGLGPVGAERKSHGIQRNSQPQNKKRTFS